MEVPNWLTQLLSTRSEWLMESVKRLTEREENLNPRLATMMLQKNKSMRRRAEVFRQGSQFPTEANMLAASLAISGRG